MKWIEHGRRPVYESEWVGLWLDDVELPDGRRYEHHVVRVPKDGVNVAIVNGAREVLMLWRHRFIIDQWGLGAALRLGRRWRNTRARRSAGGRRGDRLAARRADLPRLVQRRQRPGRLRSHLFMTNEATQHGPPKDATEAERVDWVPLADVPGLIYQGKIQDAPVIITLLLTLNPPGVAVS